MSDVASVVEEFTNQLVLLVENQANAQARAVVEAAFGGRRVERPSVTPLANGGRTRKKPPKQFCPVPGCKNVAAPVFGMVCADHKNVAKTKIKKYREARKAKKLGLKPAKAASRRNPTKTHGKRTPGVKRWTKKASRPVAARPALAAVG